MIRVGRCTYSGAKGAKRNDPTYDGFTPVIVLTKSTKYGSLGPYELKNSEGQIMENIWQFAKVYESVPASKQKLSRFSKEVTWDHPAEKHVDSLERDKRSRKTTDLKLREEYWQWRNKGFNNKHFVRYPVGKKHTGKCVGAIYNQEEPDKNDTKFEFDQILDYVEGRKVIYLPVYAEMVKKEVQFAELKRRVEKGENLLIIEVDGPHQESLSYYKEKYGVGDDFIVNNTMLVTEKNIKIMLNDKKHAFGHGYCLAMALLGKDVEWNGEIDQTDQVKTSTNISDKRSGKRDREKEPTVKANKKQRTSK